MAPNNFVRFAPALRALSAQRTLSPSIAPTLRPLHISSVLRASVIEKDPQLGRYPQFPPQSAQLRKYDERNFDKQSKTQFGETLHEEDDFLSVWAPDIHANVDPNRALRQLLFVFSIFGAFACLVYYTRPEAPFLRRTYPRDGLAAELGNPPVAARAEGFYDEDEEEEEEEEESEDDDE